MQQPETKENTAMARAAEESGAIIVEATLSLSFFMMLIFTLLSIVNIAYAQARIGIAVNSAAKEMSQYSQLFYATSLDGAMSGTGGKSSELFSTFSELIEGVSDGVMPISEELGEVIGGLADATESTSVNDIVLNAAGGAMAKSLMQKNLVTREGGSADLFLRQLGVVNGLKGISFAQTSFLESGTGNVNLVAEYEIRVLDFFGIKYNFRFVHYAFTTAWGATTAGG